MVEIVGREQELAAVRGFVAATATTPAALVLGGAPGIGKSTLLRAGVEAARAARQRVLFSHPAEAERSLAHGGLADLLEEAARDVLPELSAPRRRALEAALLLEDAPVDARALAVAVRDVLQLLGARGRVLLAVDDVQWLDDASADALAFALRRLEGADVRLLLARRVEDGVRPPLLERALEPNRVTTVPVGALSLGSLQRLLLDRLDRQLGRRTLVDVHERSGGNPFFALELARVLEGEPDPLRSPPLPDELDGLVRRRLSGLPAATREALAFVAALGTPSPALLERLGIAPETLEPALAGHVVEQGGGAIRFTHPLVSSVAYADLAEARRRRLHARVADAAGDPLVRARHLALSLEGHDADAAAELDVAAALAVERGASLLASELAEQALRLTPPEPADERSRRALAAARAHHAAGEWTRARALVADELSRPGLGPLRVEALLLLAQLESVDRAAELLEEALREAAGEPALRSAVEARLAWAARFREGFGASLEHAREALRLAEEVDDDALRVDALTMLATLAGATGAPGRTAYATRAVRLAARLDDDDALLDAQNVLADALVLEGRLDEARGLLERAYRAWCDRDEPRAADALFSLGFVELAAGRWQTAAEHAARSLDIHVQYGLERPQHHLPLAWIAVHRGELELAREHSERALALAEEQFGLRPPYHLAIIGLVALWSGDAVTAVGWLDRAHAQAAALGWAEPSQRPWTGDHVEALLAVGRTDDAAAVLDEWERDADRLGRARVLADAARCRGLIASAQGRVGAAAELLQQAAAAHERAGDDFGRARSLLALGVLRRRQRQKRPAREAIEEALAGFERLGAATWAARARGELGSIGGRTRADDLTAAERRVAALVAEGRTNREVAAALFLGERTVASHLTHVYAKLGIRSRTELARRLHSA